MIFPPVLLALERDEALASSSTKRCLVQSHQRRAFSRYFSARTGRRLSGKTGEASEKIPRARAALLRSERGSKQLVRSSRKSKETGHE